MDGVVRLAQRLSYTTAAPVGWQPGCPLAPFLEPYPTDAQMRGALAMRARDAPDGGGAIAFPASIGEWFAPPAPAPAAAAAPVAPPALEAATRGDAAPEPMPVRVPVAAVAVRDEALDDRAAAAAAARARMKRKREESDSD